MNLTALVPACVLLGALPLPLPPAQDTTPAARIDPLGQGATTVVVRYDPAAIFLTHDLVAPLCGREVRLTVEGIEGAVGRLTMLPMESNALQPKGVFVGRARVEWSTERVPVELRDEVLDRGLDQLRAALSRRLVRPRQMQLRERVQVLEDMLADLTLTVDRASQELLAADELRAAEGELPRLREAVRTLELQRRAAQQEMLVAQAGMQEFEARLQAARAEREQCRLDLERTKAALDARVSSELDLQRRERALLAASSELDQAEAQIDVHRSRVEQRGDVLVQLERRRDEAEAALARGEGRAEALMGKTGAAMGGPARAHIELRLELDRGRLAEVSAELQRVRAALATVTSVTVERW